MPPPTLTPAARLTGVGRVELGEVVVAEPGDGEVSIRVLAVGLCGSDAHWFEDGRIGDSTLDSSLILGHEFCGVIESGPRSGERVAGDPAIPCLVCEQCRRQRYNLCLNMRFAGHGTTDGALRRQLVWPERCLVPLPEGMPDEVGALLEPLGVALHAIDLARLVRSMPVGVIGCGPVGLLTIMALRAIGVKSVTATDPLDHRLRAAHELGAHVEPMPSADSHDRFDVVFETAGTDDGMASALENLRPGGRVVVVGIPPGDRTTLVASVARRKELTLAWCQRMDPGDLVRAATMAKDHLDALERLVTHRFPLTHASDAFDALVERGGLKIIVTPGVNDESQYG